MKVLLVRNADTKGYGGAEELVLNTSVELTKKNYDVLLATALPKLMNKAKRRNIRVVNSPWIKIQSWHGLKQALIPLWWIWLFRLVLWYLAKIGSERPDLLHAQNRDDWIAAGIAGWITKTRVIWSDHADLKHEVKGIDNWYKNWQGKTVMWATRFAEVITVDSKAEKKAINETIKGELDHKIVVAYNGVYDVKPSPVKKKPGMFIFGATSRLMRQKGLFELIDAFKKINQEYPETELWLVGDGIDANELKQASADNKSIYFLGYVDNPLDYAASFEVYAQPTYTEGFSLALIEAAMLGLPIITTNVGGNVEIIQGGKNGLLIPEKDSEALYKAMLKLYKNRKLAVRLGAEARKTYENNFEFSKIVENIYIPIYTGEQ